MFDTLSPFLMLSSGMRRGWVQEGRLLRQSGLWLPWFRAIVGCARAGLWSLPACTLRGGVETYRWSERTSGLYPPFFKIFVFDLMLCILSVLNFKSCYFIYLITYINLLKMWINFFFPVSKITQITRLPETELFDKLVFSVLSRNSRAGFGLIFTELPLAAVSNLVWRLLRRMELDSGYANP